MAEKVALFEQLRQMNPVMVHNPLIPPPCRCVNPDSNVGLVAAIWPELLSYQLLLRLHLLAQRLG